MMTYKEAEEYIESIPKFTKKHSLDHTKEFIKRLGNPGMKSKIIHVAGTNGKGSVCAYLQAVILSEGRSAGLFSSPHLKIINERIRVNGECISDQRFLEIFLSVKGTADEMAAEGLGHPSYFEFLFGMGMMYFAQENAEYIILETGLGGRLDATNIVEQPLLTVITSISLDHTEILGETIEQIASEKAGIIKERIPVFCDGTNKKALKVIQKTAAQKNADCREISKNAYEIMEIDGKHIAFSRTSAYDEYTTWKLANSGVYQVVNAILAIEAAEYIFQKCAHRERWVHAIFEVHWEGRLEEVLPEIYVDGAHNLGAVEAFVESVCFKNNGTADERLLPIILFSAVSDKKYEEMISYLCRNLPSRLYIVTDIEDKRKVSAEELKHVFEKYTDRKVVAEPELSRAWEMVQEEKRPGEEVYCIGSLYLAGMIKKLTDRRKTDA